MTTWLGRAALAAMIAIGAGRLGAQITTVVAPPQRPAAVQQQAEQRQQAAQDSIARVTLSGMKEWVDSAASALALSPDTGVTPASDSVRSGPVEAPTRGTSTPVVPESGRAVRDSGEFRDGAMAPDTATPIPTLALAGAILILTGMVLLGRQPSAVRGRQRQK